MSTTYTVQCGGAFPLRGVTLATAVRRVRRLRRAAGPVCIWDDQADRTLSAHAVEWYEIHGELPTESRYAD
jgi:hypothetical protein